MEELPKILPVLTLENIVIFPKMITSLIVDDERSIKLVEYVVSLERKITGAFALKAPKLDDRDEKNYYHTGVACTILKMLRFPDNTLRILVEGMDRIRIKNIVKKEPFTEAEVEVLHEHEISEEDIELEALRRNAMDIFRKIIKIAPYLSEETEIKLMNISSVGEIADFIASNLEISIKDKQKILETIDIKDRIKTLLPLLVKEETVLKLSEKIKKEAMSEVAETQKEYFLRRQLKAIQKELGEESSVIKELEKKLKEANLPKEVRETAYKEIERLKEIPYASPEYTVSRTYLDWLISLPWNKATEEKIDIKNAQKILDEDHYNLKEVKERIIEYLAVRKLNPDVKGPILCFIGPPGVGKTSLGKSIARALNRQFVRISLGGIRDEAEIRGHRRTYVGALPGRIIQGIKKAGSNNPVFMLDEIDKIGTDFRGDPSAALLEALDPEVNHSFSDHYLEIPFDLSHVMFICTGNIVDTILPALKDRMEIIHLPGYTLEEKLHIAKKFLIPRQIKENGLNHSLVEFTTSAIKCIIKDYTREAGVRNLEREIAQCVRKVAKSVTCGRKKKTIISKDNIQEFLGSPKFFQETKERKGQVGVATGLAYTPYGGKIMFVEATKMSGKSKLILTGHLGDIMKESAQTALSFIRSISKELKIDNNFFENNDLHIHVPEGAIPKDGPSAGVAIALAIISLLKNKPINPNIAVTGEITLHGKILPVGGIKEKVIAAKEGGIKSIILPKWNANDVKEIPSYIKKGIKFYFVKDMSETIPLVFNEVS